MSKAKSLSAHFNLRTVKTKGLTLLIEHSPCCILSFAAGYIGLSVLSHNPVLELGFALGGAVVGEHIGHKLFAKEGSACAVHGKNASSKIKRYGLSLLFGLASWGVHQAVFHDHSTYEQPNAEPHKGLQHHSHPHHHHDGEECKEHYFKFKALP